MFKIYNYKTVTIYSLEKCTARIKIYMYINYYRRNNAKLDRNILNEFYSAEIFPTKSRWTFFGYLCFNLVPISLGLIRRDSQMHNILFYHVYLQNSVISKMVFLQNGIYHSLFQKTSNYLT